ncbi:zinc ABC transporter substrate-binding protein [Actinokineospora auranticolor]|uniref:Zinc/manganese transport system substrate-binding protein n=1 Tax=Actinokineospora auranticolor TaxID=155976 RepID=A0A2S6GE15_9PSEU|nr:zinc ABC transporter substrate-binding protein [Actinokineospora auranticolor]PPK63477.1 zinc/manganese transport system substrate-binding protein [Actinokineospora auranticolor]
MISRTSRPHRSVATVAGLAALTLVTGTACGDSQAGGTAATGGKVPVVASTNVWASVAQAIGGDAVVVNAILSDPGADPHGYEAKPADATAFAGAEVVVSNGGGYDDFITGLAEGVDARKVVAYELVQSPNPGASAEPAPADAHGHAHGEVNEHVWYDLDTVHKVADKLAGELSAVAPEHAESFRVNAATFDKAIEDLAARAEAIGRSKPGAKVLATEPVAAYLLSTAGLTDATPHEFTEAIEEESDPSAAAVAETEALVDGKQVVAVVYNSQTETPVTMRLKEKAAAAGIPIVGVTETLPQGVTGYVDWMTKQVDALAAAVAAA